jgi:hypothetical protein
MVKVMNKNETLNPKGVVYTCVTGNYDTIINHRYIDDNWHYICFTDCPPENPQSYIWEFKPLSFKNLDNIRNNRWHKLHPHLLFTEYENSLYVDGNIDLLTCDVFNDVESQINQGHSIAIPPHFCNFNIYDEFNACLKYEKDAADIIKKQEKLFKESGFSGDYMNGRFFETNIIYRQHHNKLIVKIMHDWWRLIKHYSYRDQLSLTYILWKHNVSVPLLTDRTYREGDRVKFIYGENHITLPEAKARVVRLGQNLMERDNQIVWLNENLAALSDEIVALRDSIDEKESKINSLLNSRSWKITWPLRQVDNALRNLRQRLFVLRRQKLEYQGYPVSSTKPRPLRLEASSVCQLRCPSCPRSTSAFKTHIGQGFLKAADFRQILDKNHWVGNVELSNYGEMFLNPELLEIIKYAHERGVYLSGDNGVNLNSVAEEMLELLVKYKFHSLTCSIDGASNDTYKIYRVKGNYDAVMDNIKIINYYKRKYSSDFPLLAWQFVIFGHNEHELPRARKKAADLGMRFQPKLSWDENFSPLRDVEFVKAETGLKIVSRKEYLERDGLPYLSDTCQQLWDDPQINWDGKVLGCCRNFWGDFGGNAFTEGLITALGHEKINYARDMLSGKKPAREDIPCTTCEIYLTREAQGRWVQREVVTLDRAK